MLVATQPIDFRKGADSLAAIVQTVLRHDPFSGTIYTRVKFTNMPIKPRDDFMPRSRHVPAPGSRFR